MRRPTLVWSSFCSLLILASLVASLPERLLEKRNNCGQGIGSCSNNMCCSEWGYCGTTAEYCGEGCQAAFGRCDGVNPQGACGDTVGSCQDNMCCSQWGYCGTTAEYCGAGCQKDFGRCDPPSSSPCGQGIGKCPAGQCCSQWGWCGTSDAYCGNGCQADFGQCNSESIPSPDDSCGPSSIGNYTCTGSTYGKCCSKWGWCGDLVEYCGDGCQANFGICN